MDKHAFMRACREGGDAIEQALRALDRSFHAVLHRECARALRDREAAADLVQETFIKVWQRCATFRGDSELLPWIRSILRHGILDRLRRPDREEPLADEDAPSPEPPATPALQEDAVRRAELHACFERGWARFSAASPQHAAVLAWIVEDGLTNEEVGELLGRTPGATREFLSQCRKKARVHLAEWHARVSSGGPA